MSKTGNLDSSRVINIKGRKAKEMTQRAALGADGCIKQSGCVQQLQVSYLDHLNYLGRT
jgi:hypothetical protein